MIVSDDSTITGLLSLYRNYQCLHLVHNWHFLEPHSGHLFCIPEQGQMEISEAL